MISYDGPSERVCVDGYATRAALAVNMCVLGSLPMRGELGFSCPLSHPFPAQGVPANEGILLILPSRPTMVEERLLLPELILVVTRAHRTP